MVFNETPVNPITAPGAIVQVPGTGAVQASFADSQVMQPRTVATPASVTTVDPYSNRASYNRLADERFESLLKCTTPLPPRLRLRLLCPGQSIRQKANSS